MYKLQELKEIARENLIPFSAKNKRELFSLLKRKGLLNKRVTEHLKMRMGPEEDAMYAMYRHLEFLEKEVALETLKQKIGKPPHYDDLIEACATGDIEQIKQLFKEFPGVIDKSVFKDAFIKTVSGGDYLAVVKYLVAHADENIHSWSGFLYWAALEGRIKIVKYLLDSGIDVNIRIDRRRDGSAINAAARSGHLNVVRYLVLRGADPRGNADEIMYAAVSGNLKMLKFFVEKCGLDPHIDKDKAVRLASEYNHFNIVKYLVLHGAPTTNISAEFRDRLGETLTAIARGVKTQWRNKMERDEADVSTRFGKYMMEKNYNDYLKMEEERISKYLENERLLNPANYYAKSTILPCGYMPGFAPYTCVELPLRDIKYIIGPCSFNYFKYAGRNIYLFGEAHLPLSRTSTKTDMNPSNTIMFAGFVNSLVRQNPRRTYDLMYESPFFLKSRKMSTIRSKQVLRQR